MPIVFLLFQPLVLYFICLSCYSEQNVLRRVGRSEQSRQHLISLKGTALHMSRCMLGVSLMLVGPLMVLGSPPFCMFSCDDHPQ